MITKSIDINSIRKQFPILNSTMRGNKLIFFDNAASNQKPQHVTNAINHYYHSYHANVHRGVYELSQEATYAFENARNRIQKFINASTSAEIIFTKGTTESINLVASSFGEKYIRQGDEILLTEMEHHSNIVPWHMICQKKKATIKVIPINNNGELNLSNLPSLINEKTKIVSLTHVSNTLGTINPIKKIIQLAHKQGVPVLVDGAQAIPHLQINVQDLGADFYTFSGHKMYGPTGFGILYGKTEWLDNLPPYQGGGEMIKNVSFQNITYNTLPFKFEAGTPNIAAAIGMAEACDFMDSIGTDNIIEHEMHLLNYAESQLRKIDDLLIIGQAHNKASVISFNVQGIHHYDLGTILDKYGVAVRTGHHCTQPLMDRLGIDGTIRISFAVYNTIEEIDVCMHALKKAIQILK